MHARESFLDRGLKGGMIVLLVLGSFMVGAGLFFRFGQQKHATILYHYNAEYRAGNQAIEDAIINKAIPELIKMYHRHPDWHWTLNLQVWALENMSLTNATIFGMLREQVNRGQCELIGSALWSYQMLAAFSLDDVAVSLTLAREKMIELGFTRFPRVLFFQESQSLAGIGQQVFKQHGYDAVMIGTHALALHDIPFPAPLLKSRLFNDPATDFYYLPYNWLPEGVQDGIHLWTFLATGETVTGRNVLSTQGTGQGEDAYLPDPDLIRSHEEHLQLLHGSGYRLMTIHDYITMLEDREEYAWLDRYVHEMTWRDLPGFAINRDDSNGLWTWMGKNTARGNATHPGNDDGAQLADTYRTGNYLKAIRTLLLATWNSLDQIARATFNGTLNDAYKFYFKAQGTDAYGWEPGWIEENVLHETDYSRVNNQLARDHARVVLTNITTTLSLGDLVQVRTVNMSVGAGGTAFSNDTASWMNLTSIPTTLGLGDLPAPLAISVTLDAGYEIHDVAVQNCTLGGFEFQVVVITIPETTGLRITVVDGTFPWYSPTLHETRALQFVPPGTEPCFLPLSNGLLFFGTEENGVAVIKNCSTRHVAVMVQPSGATAFIESTVTRNPYTITNVHHSFIVVQGTLAQAIELANLVNIRPVVNLDASEAW